MVDAALYAQLQALCRRALPERLDQRISQIETQEEKGGPIQRGLHRRCLTFTLSWREGRQPRIERLLLQRYDRDAVRWADPEGVPAQRAWQLMRWLFGLGLPIPHVYTVEEGGGSLLLARPEGEPLQIGQGAEAAACMAALAGFLAALHRLQPPDPVRAVLADASREAVLAQIARAAETTENEGAKQAVNELRVQMEGIPPCVVHGDPRPVHVCNDARGVTALLGWENGAWGDPRWDVACLVQVQRANGADALAETFNQAYARHAGQTLDHMPYWEALSALHTWMCAGWAADETLTWRFLAMQALDRWRAAVKQAAAAEQEKE